jgi:polysaccharide biosynthesis/export protein
MLHLPPLRLLPLTCALGLLACGSLLACAGDGRYMWVHELPAVAPQAQDMIVPGDMVSVRVFAQDGVSTRARVRRDGMLPVPLAGDIPAANKLPTVLAREIEQRLAPFVNAPHVTVTIDESQVRASVVGEVLRPGAVVLESPAGVLPAIALAGGVTEYASPKVFVVRLLASGQVQRIRFSYESLLQGEDASTRFRLQSGDTVVVE